MGVWEVAGVPYLEKEEKVFLKHVLSASAAKERKNQILFNVIIHIHL